MFGFTLLSNSVIAVLDILICFPFNSLDGLGVKAKLKTNSSELFAYGLLHCIVGVLIKKL
jgi:hypothetical protein